MTDEALSCIQQHVDRYQAEDFVAEPRDRAAVLCALIFGAIHVPMNLVANGDDWLAALANAVFYQSTVGLIACLAFMRHRAPVPIGIAHGLAIA